MPKDYYNAMAEEALVAAMGRPPMATKLERELWLRLVSLEAAALRVLSDIDDDGVAEGADVAIQRLRAAC